MKPDGSFTLSRTHGPDRIVVTDHDWRVMDRDGPIEKSYHPQPINMVEAAHLMRELARRYDFPRPGRRTQDADTDDSTWKNERPIRG